MGYIYQITNDINDKVYVGKTNLPIEKRFKEHCKDRLRRRCEKRPLYSAMNKYGVEHFQISLLEETDNTEEREIYWIEKLNSYGKTGYNATRGGDGKMRIMKQQEEEIVETYKKLQSEKETAEKLGYCVQTIRMVLRKNDIRIKRASYRNMGIFQKIARYEKRTLKLTGIYYSYSEAGQALGKEEWHINECVNRRSSRKTAYGYYWIGFRENEEIPEWLDPMILELHFSVNPKDFYEKMKEYKDDYDKLMRYLNENPNTTPTE